MSKPQSKTSKSQRLLNFLIDDIGVRVYICTFCAVVCVLGYSYYFLTPFSHGLGSNGQIVNDLSFRDSLYFSVVTVSSLGYGDIHPMGVSKFLAGFEVLFGLGVMGIILAKLTSSRFSHYVTRLYKSELQQRLDEFGGKFSGTSLSLKTSMQELGQAFQETPSSEGNKSHGEAVAGFSDSLFRFQLHVKAFSTYVEEENYIGDFFEVAPQETLNNATEALEEGLFVLGQLVTSLTPEAMLVVYDRDNRKSTSKILDDVRLLNDFVSHNCKTTEICNSFSKMGTVGASIPESYYIAPVIDNDSQPDQAFVDESEPN